MAKTLKRLECTIYMDGNNPGLVNRVGISYMTGDSEDSDYTSRPTRRFLESPNLNKILCNTNAVGEFWKDLYETIKTEAGVS
jgi:hypothetical protein